MEEIISTLKEHAEKVKDGAVKLSQTVFDKASTVVDQTKIKFAIGKTEDKIKSIYSEIGCEIYASYAGGATEYPDVQEMCEKLDALNKELADLKEQLAEISSTVKCSSCGAYNNDKNVYCASCGEKLSKDADGGFAEAAKEAAETAKDALWRLLI